MSGDEPQTGVRGGVTQITPTDGQREGSKVSNLNACACLCVKKYTLEKSVRKKNACALPRLCVDV